MVSWLLPWVFILWITRFTLYCVVLLLRSEDFTHTLRDCFTDTGADMRMPGKQPSSIWVNEYKNCYENQTKHYQNKRWVYLIVYTVGWESGLYNWRTVVITRSRTALETWHASISRLCLWSREQGVGQRYVPLAQAVRTQAWSPFIVHWVVMMPTLSSVAATQVVRQTTVPQILTKLPWLSVFIEWNLNAFVVLLKF